MLCKTCNGTGEYKSGLHPVSCPDCDGTGFTPGTSEKIGPWETRWATNHHDRQPHAVVDAENGHVIAEVVRQDHKDRSYEFARLIAAAPDLLHACEMARDFGSQGDTHEGLSVSEFIRAAIAKATGK